MRLLLVPEQMRADVSGDRKEHNQHVGWMAWPGVHMVE